MDGFAHNAKMGGLFAEDFDVADVAPEPEVIEPVFSVAEVTAAREAAWREGYAAGLEEGAKADGVTTRQALTAIAEQLTAERELAATQADISAQATAQLLLDSLAATFPTLCARYGDAEVQALIRTVLPALTQESAITVRAHPRTAAAVAQEIGRLDSDLAARVQTVECEGIQPGDVRVTWHNGTARRDAAALWKQVAAVLVPEGLLRSDMTIRETADAG